MSLRRLSYTAGSDDDQQRLDLVASRWLPAALGRRLSKAAIRRLLVAGVIRVGGRPVRRAGQPVVRGQRLEALVDEARLPAEPASSIPAPVAVLYEDAWLIAVAKPAGLAMHATADPARPDLFTRVRQQLGGAMVGGAEAAYLGLHHRLDRDTSGVVLFTKDAGANRALAAQFEQRQLEKVYHALTSPGPTGRPERWRVANALAPVGTGRRARMASVPEGGERAVTRFAVLARHPGALLVEARPETGRKHQIRAHLAERGLPVLGDLRYGGLARVGPVRVPRTMLHARRLSLRHPMTGEALVIECEYPADFRAVLDALSACCSACCS